MYSLYNQVDIKPTISEVPKLITPWRSRGFSMSELIVNDFVHR